MSDDIGSLNVSTLGDIAKQFQVINPKFNFFHGKLYSFIPPQPETFFDFARTLKIESKVFPNNWPATMIVGKLGALIPFQSKQVLTLQDGQLRILAHLSDLKLPDCNYLALMAPVEKTETNTNYRLGIDSISFLRALMSLPFGKLPFYTWIADFDFDPKGEVSLPGEVIRMPLFGDLFRLPDVALVNEMNGRLVLQQEAYRTRLQRACNFFAQATNQKDEAFRFSSYWIALEIIVGGKSDAIRSKLAKAYEQQNKKFSDDALLFYEIEHLRNRLIHHGEFGVLRSYQERLLQLYFWDIVVHQIGLKPRQLAKTFVDSGLIEIEKNSMSHPAP